MQDDDLVAMAKIVARNATLINMISLQLADQACLVAPFLERCGRCEAEPITVKHRHMGMHACDRCAAEMIVKSGRAFVNAFIIDPQDPLNEARASLMNEDDWVDTDDAVKVRRVMDYVRIIKEREVGEQGYH